MTSSTLNRHGILRLAAVVLTGVCLSAWVPCAQAQRVALLIGNSGYQVGPLRNPPNDVREMKAALEAVGFKVQPVVLNADQKEMKRAVRDFGDLAQGAEVAFLYYSGHATQANGENYLIPIRATIEKEADYEVEAVSANALMSQITGARPKAAIVVLDACRDNPYAAVTKSTSKGLGRMTAPTGTMIAFATAANATASDEGHYARVLAAQIRKPGAELIDVFRDTATEVFRLTGGKQDPRVSEFSINQRIYLAGQSAVVLAPTTQDLAVLIGHVGPTSGSIAHLGKDNENGARMAIDELNVKGVMIGGRKARFELLAEDDAGDPKLGIQVAQKLVSSKVNGVIGHLNSGTSIPASKIYSDAGIPQISPSATHPKFTRQGYKTTFRMVADDVRLGGALGKYAVKELKGKGIFVIDDRTAYGQLLADEFEKGVKAAGGTTSGREFTTNTATNFDAILTSVRAKRSDIVFFGGMDVVAGPIIRQMKELGINAKFLGGDGICSGELPQLSAGAMAEGQVICAEAGGVDVERRAGMDRFREDFKKKFNIDVQIYAPFTYDATKVMVDAMVRAGSADPAKYLPELAKTSGYKGVTDTISFDANGDSENAALALFTYKGGKREQIAVVH